MTGKRTNHTMKERGIRWRNNVAAFIGYLVLAGCSTLPPNPPVPCAACNEQRIVRVVPLGTAPAHQREDQVRPLLHVTAEEWEAILRSVMVRSLHNPLLGPSYRGATERLFHDEEVHDLAALLHPAFQQAGAQEQVVFALARPSETGVTQVTSGAWFAEAGHIHLRLANCLVSVTMPSIKRHIWKDPLFAAGSFYEVVPSEQQALVTKSGGGLFHPDPVELVINDAPLRETSTQTDVDDRLPSPPSPSLEERLRILKRLHEQGVITEEDYRTKKQQLLDQL